MKNDLDYERELEIYCKSKGIWDNENKRPTSYVINRIKNIERAHPDGNVYTEGFFDGFTTKRKKYPICLYCHKELKGEQQRKYCSAKCRDLSGKIRKKFQGLIPSGAQCIMITKEVDGIPKWNKMKVTFNDKQGKYFSKPLTNKNGKLKN